MKRLFIVVLLSVGLLTSGCIIKFSGSNSPTIAGVFKSSDKGNTWVAKNLFLFSGGVGSIAGVSVDSLNFDPQDHKAIYLGSEASGLFYSYDGGDSWFKAKPIGDVLIQAVAVDPKNKCVVYATANNTVLKSVDCSRTWQEIYIDTRADKAALSALAVDHYNNLVIYAGNKVGDILKSIDGGGNWQVITSFKGPITKILIDPRESRTIYVATEKKGIFKTITGGADWFDLNTGLKPYSGSLEYKNLIFDQTNPDSLILVAKYGLIKTVNGGETWEPIKLLTTPATADIYSIAINPTNNQEIYYATASTFYKSVDSGQTWITRRLPSKAIPTYLLIDPDSPDTIYLGLSVPKKK